jgi:hypothetical protein
MTDFSQQGPMHPIWVDVIDAVRTLMETFRSDTLEGLQNSGSLLETLAKLETHERRSTTYALVAFAGVTVRWAASEINRDEADVLAEIARGVGVDPQ